MIDKQKRLASKARYRERHRAELREKARQRYWGMTEEERAETLRRHREYMKTYREKYRERINARARELRLANLERCRERERERKKAWYEKRKLEEMRRLIGT